jgi:hypothetical protein
MQATVKANAKWSNPAVMSDGLGVLPIIGVGLSA